MGPFNPREGAVTYYDFLKPHEVTFISFLIHILDKPYIRESENGLGVVPATITSFAIISSTKGNAVVTNQHHFFPIQLDGI